MNRGVATALGVAIAAAAAGWWVSRAQEAPSPGSGARVATDRASVHPQAAIQSPATVLRIAPSRASPPPVSRVPVRSGPMQELLAAKQYRVLWERLRNSPEGATGDGAYALYRIASRCANVTDRPRWRQPNRGKSNDEVREEFMQTLAANDPQREKRLAAFEEVNTSKCDGIDLTLTQADLRTMLAKAVDAGSAEARAVQLGQQIEQGQRGRWDHGTLTDAQIDSLKQLAATKDPGAILEAGRLLSNGYRDLTVRDGADGPMLEAHALHNAWTLVACEYGYPCGQDNPRLQQGCAYVGHCDASNLQDYLYYYAASPHDSQLMNQYEALLRNAVETGDWSHFTLVRGPRPPNSPQVFVGPQG
jgi:hypothetical protein